jgi:SAM-dependent methyltransferase
MRARDWDGKWRERLAAGSHAETTGAPNRFLVAEAKNLAPGRALDLACGAGRNAVWLAERGWRTTAVDFSEVALAAARRLASERGVTVEWNRADLLAFEPPRGAFDLVLVLYLQVPAVERRLVLRRAAGAVAPGGRLLAVGHHSDNFALGYGGPKRKEVLFTETEAAAELPGLVVERAERVLRPVETDEGVRHAVDALVVASAI